MHQHLPGDTGQQPMCARFRICAGLFGCEVGLSDHTMGVGVSVAAVAMGATVIEKHFTLRPRRRRGGRQFLSGAGRNGQPGHRNRTRLAGMGHVQYGATEAEQKSLQYRRSLYVVRDIAEGEIFSADNIRAIRPGLGLAPKHIDAVLGRKARHGLKRGAALSWDGVG